MSPLLNKTKTLVSLMLTIHGSQSVDGSTNAVVLQAKLVQLIK